MRAARTLGAAGAAGLVVVGIGAASPSGLVLAWIGFGVGVWLLRSVPRRVAIGLLIVGAVAMVLSAGFGPPRSSDDLYRYVWDGRVQAAGIDPYRYEPTAPELADLRDPTLWPEHSNWCVPDVGCSLINRPTVPTIYPPGAQVLFLAVHWLAPAGSNHVPVQLLGLAFALGMAVLLWVATRSPERLALWAWCPLVPVEAVNNGHIDVVGAFLTAAALLVLARIRPGRLGGTGLGGTVVGGMLLGLAGLVKLTPLVVTPAVLRRRPVPVLIGLSTVVAVGYLPHVLLVGPKVFGYLPGYASEEGYGGLSAALGLLALGAAAVWAWRTARPDEPWHAAALLAGVALLVTAPAYPWYALLLLALVGLGARPEWLAVAAAGYLVQYHGSAHLTTSSARWLGYGLAAVVVLVGWLIRRTHGLPPRSRPRGLRWARSDASVASSAAATGPPTGPGR